MRKYNEIYDDRVVKYTINIPIPVYQELQRRAKSIGMYHIAPYVRAIIEKELNASKPTTMSQILEQNKRYELIEPRVIPDNIRRECIDPPRKYEGFGGGLRRSLGTLLWFRRINEKRKNVVDKTDSSQLYFW